MQETLCSTMSVRTGSNRPYTPHFMPETKIILLSIMHNFKVRRMEYRNCFAKSTRYTMRVTSVNISWAKPSTKCVKNDIIHLLHKVGLRHLQLVYYLPMQLPRQKGDSLYKMCHFTVSIFQKCLFSFCAMQIGHMHPTVPWYTWMSMHRKKLNS